VDMDLTREKFEQNLIAVVSVYKIVNCAHVAILLPSMSNKSLQFHLFVWAFFLNLQTVIIIRPDDSIILKI
jgi:hypothetical protein